MLTRVRSPLTRLSRFIGRPPESPYMTNRETEEYRALRDTIRERGTARHWIAVVGFATWAMTAIALAALATAPVLTLIPLLVLASIFEVVFTLHTAVERVGRYIQVFHEPDAEVAAWEHVAMAYGRTFGGGGIDALFSPLFATATLLNLLPILLAGPAAIDWTVAAAAHALFIVRIITARRQSARQRAIDLERFSRLKVDRLARPTTPVE